MVFTALMTSRNTEFLLIRQIQIHVCEQRGLASMWPYLTFQQRTKTSAHLLVGWVENGYRYPSVITVAVSAWAATAKRANFAFFISALWDDWTLAFSTYFIPSRTEIPLLRRIPIVENFVDMISAAVDCYGNANIFPYIRISPRRFCCRVCEVA